MTAPERIRPSWLDPGVDLIDADLHLHALPEDLAPRLAAHGIADETAEGIAIACEAAGTDLTTRSQPIVDPDTVGRAWLDRHGIVRALCHVRVVPANVSDPRVAHALAAATNDWQIENWLAGDARLWGSIVVDPRQPRAAAAEIDRVAGRARFAHVLLPLRTAMLLGNREYWPLYEAAAAHNLALAIHAGGITHVAPTSSGWPSYRVEEEIGMSQIAESQIMNIISEGVFDRVPALRLLFLECGWAWIPAWMWRMDKEWKGLRREIPWVRDAPSAYIRRHMRFSLHPVDVPDAAAFLQVIEHLLTDELILFSSGYPDAAEGSIARALPDGLPATLRARIASGNARAFYGD